MLIDLSSNVYTHDVDTGVAIYLYIGTSFNINCSQSRSGLHIHIYIDFILLISFNTTLNYTASLMFSQPWTHLVLELVVHQTTTAESLTTAPT
eukprot:5147676-Amphidinium_carterae.4